MTQSRSSSTLSRGCSLVALVMYGTPKEDVETFANGCNTYFNTRTVVSRETMSFLFMLTTWSNAMRTTAEAISS